MLEQKIEFLQQWFRKKTNLINVFFGSSKNEQCLPICYTGDIYYAYLGVNIGTEIDKTRPVLIFQSRHLRRSKNVIVLPLTTNLQDDSLSVLIDKSDLQFGSIQKSKIVVTQIKSISKTRLTNKIAKLNKDKLESVEVIVKKIFPFQINEKGTNSRLK